MRFAQEISIFNPFAIERQVIALGTSITQTAREIELRADELYAEKSSVYDLSSRLTIMAGQISSEVTQRENGDTTLSSRIDQTAEAITTEIQNRQSADSTLSSRITQTSQSITSEVTARQSADNSLSSRIDQSPHTITMSISNTAASKTTGPSITLTVKDANGRQISQNSGTIKIDGNVVFTNQLSTAGQTTINGSNITTGVIKDSGNNTTFNLTTGALDIKNGSITLIGNGSSSNPSFRVTNQGVLTARRGTIGDFSIGTGLYYGKTSYTDARSGIYVGPDGFSVGKNGQYTGFRVKADGTPIANYLKFIDNNGHESSYGFWCDEFGRIASGGAIYLNQERMSAGGGNYIVGPSIIDGYVRIDSDRRVKKNIRYLTEEESTEFILALKPVEYEFNDQKQEEAPTFWGGVRHGFIAQDVVEILGPEEAERRSIVSKNNWDGMYEFRYDELTADLVGICQKQQQLIDDLEQRLSNVEALHDGDGK